MNERTPKEWRVLHGLKTRPNNSNPTTVESMSLKTIRGWEVIEGEKNESDSTSVDIPVEAHPLFIANTRLEDMLQIALFMDYASGIPLAQSAEKLNISLDAARSMLIKAWDEVV